MTSYHMYQYGYVFPVRHGFSVNKEIPDCFSYFNTLSKQIVSEITQFGYSVLPLQLLCEKVSAVDAVTYGAVANAKNILQGSREVLVSKEMQDIPCLPEGKIVSFRSAANDTTENLLVDCTFLDFRAVSSCGAGSEVLEHLSACSVSDEQKCKEQLEIIDAEAQELRELNTQAAERYVDFMEEVSCSASLLQKQMSQLYQSTADTISSWRHELYQLELYPLAKSYVECSALNTQAERMRKNEMLSCRHNDQLEELVDRVQDLHKKLTRALPALGLIVYMPAPGEPFDEERQCLKHEDEDAKKFRKIVKTWTSPGVLCAGTNKVLIPAEVVLE